MLTFWNLVKAPDKATNVPAKADKEPGSKLK